jgi:hypothetical protein
MGQVRVATTLLQIRRQLARHWFAADARRRGRGPPWRYGPHAVARAIVAHRTQLRVTRPGRASPRRGPVDARGRSSRRRNRGLADFESRRTSSGGPVNRNHGRSSCDVGTGPVVRRRSTLRMEAHRSTTAQAVVWACAARATTGPKGSPQATLPSRLEPPDYAVGTHLPSPRNTPDSVLLMAPYEPANAPERRLWR